MNTRHRNQMSLPLVSTTVTLVRFGTTRGRREKKTSK